MSHTSKPSDRSRRDLMKLGAVTLAAGALPASSVVAQAQPASSSRAMRFAHLTDLHMQEDGNPEQGLSTCFKHVQSLDDKPALIIQGGDLVTGNMSRTFDSTKPLYDRVTSMIKGDISIPTEHVVGNHCIWGWTKRRSNASGSEALYGKAWWQEVFSREKTYKSFDQNGWHFILLDTVQPFDDGYEGRIDDEQFEWLSNDLAKTPARTPVCVITHIPVLCAGLVLTDGRPGEGKNATGEPDRDDGIRIPRPSMLVDAWRVHDLFTRHANVKLVLSGHVHINERLDYDGIAYICGGAVSGTWWRDREADRARRAERRQEAIVRPLRSANGYGLVDLFADGRFDYRYVDFGWKPA